MPLSELYAACEKHLRSGKTFILDSVNGRIELRQKDIYYFESERNYLIAHTAGNGAVRSRGTLSRLAEELKADDFCRIHNAFVINLANVKRIEGVACVVMKDDTGLPVGAKYRGAFKSAYMEFTNRRFAKC